MSDIFEIVKRNDFRTLKKVFKKENVKQKDKNGVYLTFYAALNGREDIFDYLTANKVPIRGSDKDKNNIFLYALKGNNPNIIKVLLAKNKSINPHKLNIYNAPAFLYIEKNTKSEIIDLFLPTKGLLDKKYRVKFGRCFKERNILYYALKKKNKKLIETLLIRNVKFSGYLYDDCMKKNKRIFYYILKYCNKDIIEKFITKGVSIKLGTEDIKDLFKYFIDNSKYKKIKFLTDELKYKFKNILINYQNRNLNLLNYSVAKNEFKIVKHFIKHFDIEKVDEYFCKPVNYAIIYSEFRIFKLLVTSKNINYIVPPYYNFLMFACEYKRKDIVKYLLNRDDFDLAFEYDNENKLDFSEDMLPTVRYENALTFLIKNDFTVSYVKKAFKRGCRIREGHLLLALNENNFKVIDFLLKNSFELNLKIRNYSRKDTIESFIAKMM